LEAPVMLIGHSLGGYFGIKLCLQHPELVRRLMLINPLFKAEQLNRAAQLLRRQPELWAGLLGLTPNWLIDRSVRWDPVFLKGVSGSARRRAADSLKMASPQILNLVHDIPDLTPRLSQVSTPTLLVWGADDRTLNPDYFPELAAWLPHVRERALAGCGHQPHLIQTERMIELALEFLLTAPFD
jgi:pimeloyl-ACP methyl ester carboxylesterase